MPTVTGMTLDNAVAALERQGLTKGDVTQVYDDTIPEGSVVRQSPADGKAPTGAAVDLWVSKGHAPVPIPAVIGTSQHSAEKALRAAGFSPVVHTAYSNDVQRGDVISVDPGEATKTPYGSSVTLTVSQGPETFPVPSLHGALTAGRGGQGEGLRVARLVLRRAEHAPDHRDLTEPGGGHHGARRRLDHPVRGLALRSAVARARARVDGRGPVPFLKIL